MRLSGLTCFLLLLSFSLFAQPADYELIRKDLEKVDSLIFTNNPFEADLALRKIKQKKLSGNARLLLEVYDTRVLILKKQYDEAAAHLAALKKNINEDADFATGHFNLAKGILFFRNRDNDSTLLYLSEALACFEKSGIIGRIYLAVTYNQLVKTHNWRTGDFEKGISASLKCFNILDSLQSVSSIYHADANYCMGSIYNQLGNTEKARMYVLRSAQYSKELGWKQMEFDGYVVLGNIDFKEGRYQSAIPYYELAIANIIENFGPKSYSLINYYNNCGFMFSMVGDIPRSLRYLYESKSIAWELTGKSSVEASNVYHFLADVHLKSGSIDSAKFYYLKNLNIKASVYGKKHRDVGAAYSGLARVYEELNMIDSSLYFIQKAIISSYPSFHDENVSANPVHSQWILASHPIYLLYQKEKYLLTKWDLESNLVIKRQAKNLYHTLDSIVSLAKKEFSSDVSKLFLLEHLKAIHETGIEVYSRLLSEDPGNENYLSQFFSILQKNKSVLLLEDIYRAEKVVENIIPKEYRDKEKTIRSLLARFEAQTNMTVWSDSIAMQFIRASNELDSLNQIISVQYPIYYGYKMDSSMLSLDELKPILIERNSMYVEYYWGTQKVYSLIFDGHSFSIRTIENVPEIKKYLDILTNYLANSVDDPMGYESYAYELLRMLLPGQVIEQMKNGRILHVIADGPLTYLPFEALIMKKLKEEPDFGRLEYLIKSTSVTYDFSAAFLKKPYISFNHSTSKVLALGTYSPDNRNTSSLPGTRKELEAIKDTHGGMFYTQAKKSDFTDNIQGIDIIHLAIHGVADTASLYGSYLQFFDEDYLKGRLYAYELYDKSVSCDLVVLTACQSGVGKLMEGEGVLSIGRAFKYAGASGIIQSLWMADDNATSFIVKSLYQNLSAGTRPQSALYRAKREFIDKGDNKTAHPSRWAGFIMYGDFRKDKKNLAIYFVAGLLILSLLYIVSYRYRKIF